MGHPVYTHTHIQGISYIYENVHMERRLCSHDSWLMYTHPHHSAQDTTGYVWGQQQHVWRTPQQCRPWKVWLAHTSGTLLYWRSSWTNHIKFYNNVKYSSAIIKGTLHGCSTCGWEFSTVELCMCGMEFSAHGAVQTVAWNCPYLRNFIYVMM